MPPVVPNRHAQLGQMLAAGPNGVRALATQQDIAVCDPDGLVVYRQGQLHQWPPATWDPAQFTTGHGMEVLNGLDGPPVQRSGQLTWQYAVSLTAAAAVGATSITVDGWVNDGGGVYATVGGQTIQVEDSAPSGSDWLLTLSTPLAQAQSAGAGVTIVWTFVGSAWLAANNVRLVWYGGGSIAFTTASTPTYMGQLAVFNNGSYAGTI